MEPRKKQIYAYFKSKVVRILLSMILLGNFESIAKDPKNFLTIDTYDFEMSFTDSCDQFDNDSTLDVSTSRYQYDFDGQAIFDSGTYTKTVTSSNECDSLVTLNLTFLGQTCLLPKPILGDTIVYTECHNAEADWYQYTVQKDGLLVIDPTYSAVAKTVSLYNDCDTEVQLDHRSYTEQGYLLTHEVLEGQVFIVKVAGSYAFSDLLFEVVPIENGLSCEEPISPVLGTNELNNHLGERYYQYFFLEKGNLTISSCSQGNDTYLNILNDDCGYTEHFDGNCQVGAQEYYEYGGEIGDVINFSWSPDFFQSVYDGITEFEISFEAESTCPTTTAITDEGTINVDNSVGDHWFEYTPTQNEFIIVATWGWSSEDTKISLYDGDCIMPFRTEDDNAGLQTIIQQQLEADVTYYIQFHDEKTSEAYWAIVYFSSEEIPGLTCGDAINIEPGTHIANNLFGDQWFTYTFPTDGEVTISSCGSTEDTILDLQSDCDTFIDLSDDDCGFQSTLTYSGNAGENIKMIWGADYEPEDLYDFQLSFISSITTWNGDVSSEWNTAANWDGGIVPTAIDDVLIQSVINDPTISSSNVVVNDLTLEDGAVLMINNDQALTINGDLTAGTGYLDVTFGASLITNGAVSGANHIFRRTTTFDTTTGRYSAIGSPVSNEETDVLGSLIYGYDESIDYGGGNQNRYFQITNPEIMNSGDAYFSAYTGEVVFEGTPNTGNIDISLVYNASEETNAGFNLVSNPYPSAIDFPTFVAANMDISGTIYLWDDGGSDATQRTNSDFLTVNSIGEVSDGSGRAGDWNGAIGATQGFFVKASSAGALHFTNEMRGTDSNSNSSFFRKMEEEIATIMISMTDESGNYSETLIGFPDDAMEGVDRLYDAIKMSSSVDHNLYSLIEAEPFAIQGFPLNDNLEIPLGIDLASSGDITFSIAKLSNLLADYAVLIKDNKTQVEYLIDERNHLVTSISAGQRQSRYSLVLRRNNVLSAEINLKTAFEVFTDRDYINIQGEAGQKINYRLVSLMGEVIIENHDQMFSKSNLKISRPDVKKGLYILQLSSSYSNEVHKLILK